MLIEKTTRAALIVALALTTAAAWPRAASAETVLRIGMTAADIANTAGIPDQGFEGYRFVGYQLYDALVRWDLSQGERLPDIAPALAESWEVDKNESMEMLGVTRPSGAPQPSCLGPDTSV